MNARNFAPIECPLPDYRKAGPNSPPPVLEFARAEPDYIAADEAAEWGVQNFRPAKPADPDDVFSQDEDVEAAEDVAELLSTRPAHPSGKWVGIGIDACAALLEVVQACRLPANYDVFSEVDVDRWEAILKRAGVRL